MGVGGRGCWENALGFLEADHLYLDYVGRGPSRLPGLPAGSAISRTKISPTVLPGQWPGQRAAQSGGHRAVAAYDKVSDLEAKQRADFDIRWKVALGIEVEDRPFAKSTNCEPS